jgi:hypothetical protein
MRQCPFLEYAVAFVFTFAERAARLKHIGNMFDEIPFETWRLVADEPTCPSLLRLLVIKNLPCLVDVELQQIAKRCAEERKSCLDAEYHYTDKFDVLSTTCSCTALTMAVSMGDVYNTRTLLRKGADVNSHCPDHGSPLFAALTLWTPVHTYRNPEVYGDSVTIRHIIDTAAERVRLELVMILFEYNAADPFESPDSGSPVLEAIRTNDWEKVMSLLRYRYKRRQSASDSDSESSSSDLESGDGRVPPKKDAEPAFRNRVYNALWGRSIRLNLPS